MIITHAYRSRSAVRGRCIVGVTTITASGPMTYPCGKEADEHVYTNPNPPGDMHEPKPYTGELDWPDSTTA